MSNQSVMASGDIKPFQIAVPDEKLSVLKKKLELAEFPDELENSDWDLGVPLSTMKRLVSYWKDSYDWRAAERKMNQIPQFLTTIDVEDFGPLEIHFQYVKSSVDGAIPLCFVHGWPGSFLEAEKIIHDLTNPAGKGPAFDIVITSLPGFGFSEYPTKRDFGLLQYAEVCHKVMLKLGYDEYVTQGGDWGYHITRTMGLQYAPKHIKAQHLNNVLSSEPPKLTSQPLLWLQYQLFPYTKKEKEGVERGEWFMKEGRGYNLLQGTRPQTLGYALVDSPVALLAWILEKLHDWTDSYPWTDDEILSWISIYLFSKAGPTSSTRIYYMSTHQPEVRTRNSAYNGNAPLGISIFPKDLQIPPPVKARTQGNIVFEKYHESGGHFAAHERPKELVEDLRTMFGQGGGAYGVVKGRKGYTRQTSML